MGEENLIFCIKRSLFEWSSFLPLKAKVESFINHLRETTVESIFDENVIEFQLQLVQHTVNSKIFKKFPPCTKSTTAFIKKLLLVFESSQIEGHASFYDYVSNSANNHEKDQYFKSYFDERGNHLVSLVEKSELICNGTTGLRTWQAGKFLFKWIVDNLYHLPQAEEYGILELGSGVGYTGLCIFNDKRCTPRQITLTDHHTSVLNALYQNVIANLGMPKTKCPENGIYSDERNIVFPKTFTSDCGGRNLVIDSLDWEHFVIKESNPPMYLCDIVIGADIVFDVSVIPHLVNVIVKFLTDLGTKKVILANCLRNEATDIFFVNSLKQHNVSVEKQTHNVDDDLPLHLYIIQN